MPYERGPQSLAYIQYVLWYSKGRHAGRTSLWIRILHGLSLHEGKRFKLEESGKAKLEIKIAEERYKSSQGNTRTQSFAWIPPKSSPFSPFKPAIVGFFSLPRMRFRFFFFYLVAVTLLGRTSSSEYSFAMPLLFNRWDI